MPADEAEQSDESAARETEPDATLLDTSEGLTHESQLNELETVVSVMQEHFGDDVARVDDEPWDRELFDSEVRPRDCGNGDEYHYSLRFHIDDQNDPIEVYETAEQIVAELGLTPNANNSEGLNDRDGIYFGAGVAEGRGFVVATQTGERGFRSCYQTRCSAHETMVDTWERFAEDFREERRKRNRPPSDLPG